MSGTLASTALTAYLDDLASSKPAPGGGSAAAVIGAIAAALLSMVCRLAQLDGIAPHRVDPLLENAEALRARLLQLAEEDACAAGQMVETFHALQAAPDPQSSPLQPIVQEQLKAAATAALDTADTCHQVLWLSRLVSALGVDRAASDTGAAAAAARAARRGAILTVETNLRLIEDRDFVRLLEVRITTMAGDLEHEQGTPEPDEAEAQTALNSSRPDGRA